MSAERKPCRVTEPVMRHIDMAFCQGLPDGRFAQFTSQYVRGEVTETGCEWINGGLLELFTRERLTGRYGAGKRSLSGDGIPLSEDRYGVFSSQCGRFIRVSLEQLERILPRPGVRG